MMRHFITITVMLFASAMLTACLSVEIPIGEAINNTKDWINEERQRKKQAAPQQHINNEAGSFTYYVQ